MNNFKWLNFVLICFVFTAFNSQGQHYEAIYASSTDEVRNKIDANKYSGNSILDGVFSIYKVSLNQVLDNSLIESISLSFANNDVVTEIIFHSELNVIDIHAPASSTKEEIYSLLESKGIEYNSLVTIHYVK